MHKRRLSKEVPVYVRRSLTAGLLLMLFAAPAASAPVVINFETLPTLAMQPNNFLAAGAMQTYNLAGLFSITGGVVLGNPLGLGGFASGGTTPNAYGTSDLGDLSLLSAITLNFPVSQMVVNVTGVLFNGQPLTETYTITAFSGATSIPGQTLSNIPAASSTSDFRTFSISSTAALPITTIKLNAPADSGINGWDFFVDTIAVSTVPEPSSLIFVAGGAALTTATYRKRRAR